MKTPKDETLENILQIHLMESRSIRKATGNSNSTSSGNESNTSAKSSGNNSSGLGSADSNSAYKSSNAANSNPHQNSNSHNSNYTEMMIPKVSKQNSKIEDYSSFDKHTLFFIFYYMQHTKAQLRAAKELKNRDWLYHTVHQVWFYRQNLVDQNSNNNNAESNNENDKKNNSNNAKNLKSSQKNNKNFELGDYVIFDVDEWRCRLKRNFKFDYIFMDSLNHTAIGSQNNANLNGIGENSNNSHRQNLNGHHSNRHHQNHQNSSHSNSNKYRSNNYNGHNVRVK